MKDEKKVPKPERERRKIIKQLKESFIGESTNEVI